MKHIIIALVTLFALTSCFGGGEQRIDDGGVEVPDVVVDYTVVDNTNEESDITSESDADTKDDDILGEEASGENTETNENNSDTQDSEETQEVLNEFEDDLDDIFKDLGL